MKCVYFKCWFDNHAYEKIKKLLSYRKYIVLKFCVYSIVGTSP